MPWRMPLRWWGQGAIGLQHPCSRQKADVTTYPFGPAADGPPREAVQRYWTSDAVIRPVIRPKVDRSVEDAGAVVAGDGCAPGRSRTSDLRIRSPLLYPLSYRRRAEAYPRSIRGRDAIRRDDLTDHRERLQGLSVRREVDRDGTVPIGPLDRDDEESSGRATRADPASTDNQRG